MRDEILEMERVLKLSGQSAADLCRAAEIAPTTWWRWKEGKMDPTLLSWRRVLSEFDRLTKQEAAQ